MFGCSSIASGSLGLSSRSATSSSSGRQAIIEHGKSGARRAAIRRSCYVRAGGRFVDPDEQRRIEENKRWRRTDPEEDVWDIEKERAAMTYKREALESMFMLTSDRPDPLSPPTGDTYVCAACDHVVATSSNAIDVNGSHTHKGSAADDGAEVQIGTFSSAEGLAETGIPQVAAPEWAESKRPCLGGVCSNCKTHLGWSYRAQSGGEESFKALQMDLLKAQQPPRQ